VVPGSWFGLIGFLFFVTPGLLFDLLAARRRVGPPESTFREIGRTALASTGFSVAAILIMAACRAVWPSALPDPGRLVRDGASYVREHYVLVYGAVVVETLIAVTLVFALDSVLRRKTRARLRTVSVWSTVFREECPKGLHPFVEIRVGEKIYFGQVGGFIADLERNDREIVLVPPIYTNAAPSKHLHRVSECERLILPAGGIEALLVQYRPPIHRGHRIRSDAVEPCGSCGE
jgi:hypothetical protein